MLPITKGYKVVNPKTVDVFCEEDVVVEEGALVGCKGNSPEPVVLRKGCHIHAGAVIYSGCEIGENSHVYHHTVLMSGTKIGNNCKIGTLCHFQGEVIVGDWVTMASHCHLTSGMIIGTGTFLSLGVLSGNAVNPGGRLHPEAIKEVTPPVIEKGARLGAGAIVNPGVVIGQEALIGSGSVVSKSIPPFKIAVGAPAKVIKEVPDNERIDWNQPGLENT